MKKFWHNSRLGREDGEVITIILVLVLVVVMIWFNFHPGKAPKLESTPWAKLEVEYCIRTGPSCPAQTKVFDDALSLNVLNLLFHLSNTKGLSLIFKGRHLIRLTLASGEIWNIYFRGRESHICFHEASRKKLSYCSDVNPLFYRELKRRIEQAEGKQVEI